MKNLGPAGTFLARQNSNRDFGGAGTSGYNVVELETGERKTIDLYERP